MQTDSPYKAIEMLVKLTSDRKKLSNYILGANRFKRSSSLSLKIMIFCIVFFFNKSYQNTLIRLLGSNDYWTWDKVPAKSSFCEARRFIKPSIFKYLNEDYLSNIEKTSTFRLYKGKYRLVGADGSTIGLPRTPANQEEFGSTKNQHGKQHIARVEFIADLLNGYSLFSYLGKSKSAETKMLYKGLDTIPHNSISVLDRLYTGVGLMTAFEVTNRKFVIRARKNWNAALKKFIADDLTDQIVEVPLSGRAIKDLKEMGVAIPLTKSITVRIIRVLLSTGEYEYLITNILHEFTIEDFAEIYKLRWQIEILIDVKKNVLALEAFIGHDPENVKQEFYANDLLYNMGMHLYNIANEKLQERLKDSDSKVEKRPNLTLIFGLLTSYIPDMLKWSSSKDFKQLDHLINVVVRFPEPVRKERVVRRNKKYIRARSKYRTDTNHKQTA